MPSRDLGERLSGLIAVGGHPAVEMPSHVVDAAAEAARHPRYAPTRGLPELREAIACEHGVDPDRNVLVTVGGMQGLYLAARAFGARTVTHAPSFFFPQLVETAGGRCAVAYDWDELSALVDRSTTLVIVNTPVNPTGYAFRDRDLDAIAAALEGTDALLLSDEAYHGLLWDGMPHRSPTGHPALRERTLLLRSFSKTFAMAPWRVGYAVGPAGVVETLARELAWQALAVDGVAQAAAHAALTGPREWLNTALAELEEMRPRAVAAANDAGLEAVLPDGCAFVWAAVDGDDEEWSLRLGRDHGIPAVAGRHFHARAPHVRIPYGGRPEARAALLEAFASLATRRPDARPSAARP